MLSLLSLPSLHRACIAGLLAIYYVNLTDWFNLRFTNEFRVRVHKNSQVDFVIDTLEFEMKNLSIPNQIYCSKPNQSKPTQFIH